MLHPYLESGAGDLFSLAWNPKLQVIYVGCQNTSLQWFEFSKDRIGQRIQEITSGISTPTRKVHKFFDSYPQYTHRPADLFANNSGSLSPSLLEGAMSCTAASVFDIPASNVIDAAHHGYVYCMALICLARTGVDDFTSPADGNCQLLTGSGDETIKVLALVTVEMHFSLVRSPVVMELRTIWSNPHAYIGMFPWRRTISFSPRRNRLCWVSGWICQSLRPGDEVLRQDYYSTRGEPFATESRVFIFFGRILIFCRCPLCILTCLLVLQTVKYK